MVESDFLCRFNPEGKPGNNFASNDLVLIQSKYIFYSNIVE